MRLIHVFIRKTCSWAWIAVKAGVTLATFNGIGDCHVPPAASAPPPAIVACCMVPTPWTPLAGSLTPPLTWPSPWGWAPGVYENPSSGGSPSPTTPGVGEAPELAPTPSLIVPDSPDDTAMPEPWPVFVVGFGLFGLGVVRMGWVRGPGFIAPRVEAKAR